MKPSSIIIAAVAPSFRITFEKEAPHRILETIGRLPVRLPKKDPPQSRDDWRAIDARMLMEYETAIPTAPPPPPAPAIAPKAPNP